MDDTCGQESKLLREGRAIWGGHAETGRRAPSVGGGYRDLAEGTKTGWTGGGPPLEGTETG